MKFGEVSLVMRCDNCSFENPAGMKFCGQCAASLSPTCPKCHFNNPSDFKFCGNCGASLVADEDTNDSANAGGTASLGTDADSHAERRQLTVMFCDVVGSSALSEIVDPEDLRDIMGDYRDTCQKAVAKFQGHIAQYLGDGILTYFGYPSANEDDAYRAVQTGLELIRSMRQLNEQLFKEKGIRLSVRIGIHTGLVVIGEIGSDDKRSLALGTTPNVAARIQDLAQPDTVTISDATYRLVQSRFSVSSMGEHNLKGFSHPIHLYNVDDNEAGTGNRSSDIFYNQIPLIGREQECALIVDRLEHAKSGHGQVVLLSGEAGIGKSRLVQLLREVVDEEEHSVLECWGSPYHKNSFLHCVISVLQNTLQLDQLHSDEEKIQKLEAPLASFGISLSENIPLLAELLSIDLPEGRYNVPQTTPQQRKQKILEAILGLVMGMASDRMVVIVMEDLHWVDPTTIELLGMLIEQAPTSNIFILLSYRLEFSPPWTPSSHITQISINRLTRKQSGRMVRLLANNKDLPVSVFNEILNKTDGTPFFVEELTKMVLESDILKETHEYYELAGPASKLAIPSTLQDSLMARLDRLGASKELAQLSATLGREFSYNVLAAVTGNAQENLALKLSQLVSKELLYQRGLPPGSNYTFRHALVHEVAYESLLKKTRQKYHRKIAEILATKFPEQIQENPEIMAHHCHEAGDYDSATQYWSRAGKLAIQRSANSDATVHLTNAILALDNLPEGPKKAEAELQIQAALGLAYMLLKGYSAEEVQSAYGRAYDLCRYIGKSSSTFPVLCGLWEFYLVRAELDTAQDLAVQLQSTIPDKDSHTDFFLEAQRILGATSFWRGDFTSAEHHLQRALNTPDTNDGSRHNPVYGQDSRVAALASSACVSWLTGFPDRAFTQIDEAVQRANDLNHPFSIVYATYFSAIVNQLAGNTEKTLQLANLTMQLSKQYEFSFWQETAAMLSNWAQFELTASGELIDLFAVNLKRYKNRGSALALSYLHTLLARMLITAQRYDEADIIIEKALSNLTKSSEHFFQAEIYRLKGMVSFKKDNSGNSETETFLNEALLCAQQQSAVSLELRAAVTLGEYLLTNNQESKAKSVINNALSRLTEGKPGQDYQLALNILEKTGELVKKPKVVEPA
jgi:class 3 adenylate cyclase/predicted ATPase/energy-coupling factor transporter ATP-binding protein EcfA2